MSASTAPRRVAENVVRGAAAGAGADTCDPKEYPGGCSHKRTTWRFKPLASRDWSISAIARHTGRDRKTIRRYLAGDGGGQQQEEKVNCLDPFRPYIAARFADDAHLLLGAPHGKLAAAVPLRVAQSVCPS